MYVYAARLVKVVDGDTVDLDVDMGFDVHIQQRIRLAGINCPEHGTADGDAATAYTRAWLEQHGPNLTLRTIKDKHEKFGRLLGVITVGPSTLNGDLLTSGHAVSYDGGARTVARDPLPVR